MYEEKNENRDFKSGEGKKSWREGHGRETMNN